MSDEHSTTDVIVVGAGLAGLAAADEVRQAGLSVRLLESSARVGGRTYGWYWDEADRFVDLGGTWLLPEFEETHAMLQRFGLRTVDTLTSRHNAFDDGRTVSWSDELTEAHATELRDFCSRVGIEVSLGETLSAEAILQRLAPSPFVRSWNEAIQGYLGGNGLDQIDSAHLALPFDVLRDPDHYRAAIEGTTARLVDALAAPLDDMIVRNSRVTRIAHVSATDTYRVTTDGGDTLRASAVVIAAPLNTLDRIEITAPVPVGISTLARAGHVGRSRKYWMVLRNVDEHFRVLSAASPFAYFRSEERLSDGRMLAVALLPATDEPLTAEQLTTAIRRYLPHAALEAVTSHDWTQDEHARGAWFVPGPGQISTLFEASLSSGGLFFAGGDVSREFFGTIEGAIATGRQAGGGAAERVRRQESIASRDA